MNKLDEFDLISDIDILYDNTCYLHHTTLAEIKTVGIKNYRNYINLLTLNVDDCNEQLGLNFDSDTINIFDILISNKSTREHLCKALSFFISGEITYDKDFYLLNVNGGKSKLQGVITRNNYQDISSKILQLNFIQDNRIHSTKNMGKKAKSILQKIRKGRSKFLNSKKKNTDFNISNVISAVVAYSGSYNYENVWSLTVYQLYDLFFRLGEKMKLNFDSVRWGTWGKDEFDLSIWYKNPIKMKGKG